MSLALHFTGRMDIVRSQRSDNSCLRLSVPDPKSSDLRHVVPKCDGFYHSGACVCSENWGYNQQLASQGIDLLGYLCTIRFRKPQEGPLTRGLLDSKNPRGPCQPYRRGTQRIRQVGEDVRAERLDVEDLGLTVQDRRISLEAARIIAKSVPGG